MKEGNSLNFLRVAGHTATFYYRGVKRIYRRCRQEGHYRAVLQRTTLAAPRFVMARRLVPMAVANAMVTTRAQSARRHVLI